MYGFEPKSLRDVIISDLHVVRAPLTHMRVPCVRVRVVLLHVCYTRSSLFRGSKRYFPTLGPYAEDRARGARTSD
jgi:hypothetical protein